MDPVQSTVPAGSSPANGSQNPGVTSAPPAAGAPAGSPPAGLDWNSAPQQFRDGHTQLKTDYETMKAEHERLKADHEKWSKLGNYDDVSKQYGEYSTNLANAIKTGKALGYTEEQIRNSMQQDPKGTLAFLQQEFSKPQQASREEIDRRIREGIDESVKPIRDQWDAQQNDKANSLYEAERDRLYKSEFAEGLPDDNREEVFEILDALFAQDQAALSRLKFGNQVSDVKRHFEQAKTIFLKRHNAYIAHERGKTTKPSENGKPAKDTDTTKFMDRKLSVGGNVRDLLNV